MPESTRHVVMIALSDEDIEKIRNEAVVTVDDDRIAITSRQNQSFDPQGYKFVLGMSERALDRVSNHEMVSYGINNTGDTTEEVVVRHGQISEKLGTDMSARERVIDSGMTPDEADRYM